MEDTDQPVTFPELYAEISAVTEKYKIMKFKSMVSLLVLQNLFPIVKSIHV